VPGAVFSGCGRLLKKYGVEAWQLIFEITESNSLTNLEQANQTLGQLQKMGCSVAIDDFGTGYASYARLKNVNADILKIDGSFIRNIVSNSLDYQIVASICHLARMKKCGSWRSTSRMKRYAAQWLRWVSIICRGI
jgi:EAL domain-containing protein (putative c-di-GMP-specific phosphodiesterase class I)